MPLRREIDESIISGRKTGAEMGAYHVSAPTVSRMASVWPFLLPA
jgi:hypothetical protein